MFPFYKIDYTTFWKRLHAVTYALHSHMTKLSFSPPRPRNHPHPAQQKAHTLFWKNILHYEEKDLYLNVNTW